MKLLKIISVTVLLFSSAIFSSCNNGGEDTSLQGPADTLNKSTPMAMSATLTADEIVVVSPTWGESFTYSNKSGGRVWTIIGFILIGACALYIIGGSKNIIPFDGRIAFVIAVLGVSSLLAKPSAIHFNNDKKVSKAYLQEVGREYVLDSVYNNNLMINAASK